MNRDQLSKKYCKGKGIEIGALTFPWPMQPGSSAINVDFVDHHKLAQMYPDADKSKIKPVDIIDDANTLSKIPDEQYDFFCSSHNLEHMEDAIGAVYHWLRVLKVGGHLVMAIPEKDHCFDKRRTPTRIEHFFEEFVNREVQLANRPDHYREYLRNVDNTPEDKIEDSVRYMHANDINIHFHCWTQSTLRDFFSRLVIWGGIRIDHFEFLAHEVFVVLTKTARCDWVTK